MAISSNNISLGTPAINFNLVDAVSNEMVSLNKIKSDKATVVMFICNHCPYVKHVLPGIIQLANDYIKKGISFVAISSNDIVKYPEDAPDEMKNVAEINHFPFPYLFDESQEVARQYKAACTPDFYVFDGELKLVYHGQMDGSRPKNNLKNDGRDLREALDNILKGLPVNSNQIPSIGCGIKWK